MNITIETGLSPEMLAKIRALEPTLQQALGRAVDRVQVVWEPAAPSIPHRARLILTDGNVTRSEELTAADMDRDFHIFHRINRLWDDVLIERSRLQSIRVRESLAAEGL